MWLDQHKIIVSSDKDYFQLVTDKVSVYRPIKKEIIDVEHMLKEYKCFPANWIMIKTIQGDSSDNVPGIKGVGIKTINKLFPFLIDPVKVDLDKIFEFCQANISGSKFYKNILDEQERLKKNWQVMQLLEHTFSTEGLEKVKDALNQNPIFKPFQLRLLFMQDQAFKQIQNFDYWNQIFTPLNTYEKKSS
jgi:5'-3' exonuclease